MTDERKLKNLKMRYNLIASRPDASKTPGVMRKLARQIRNLEKKIAAAAE